MDPKNIPLKINPVIRQVVVEDFIRQLEGLCEQDEQETELRVDLETTDEGGEPETVETPDTDAEVEATITEQSSTDDEVTTP
jgi:hypothetical protein